MSDALYFPFSRCLNQTMLKRAVLLYDHLLFVDPVATAARNELYVREAEASGVDPEVTAQWHSVHENYELLFQHGIARTVDAAALQDPAGADALVAGGLD